MADQRGFEATAQCRAMDRRNDRLGRHFDGVEHRVEIRPLRGLSKFGDVRAGNESLPFAADDNRLHAVIVQALFDTVGNALADMPAEGVHRRIVHRQDQDFTVLGGGYRLHLLSPLLSGGQGRIHHCPNFASDRVGRRWRKLRHENHDQILDRINQEGGRIHATPVKFAL